jgi:hypothetical protein
MADDGPFRVGTVISPYILVQTQVGEVGVVVGELEGVKGVAPAEAVTGPYDVIARADARTLDELGRLLVGRIQAIAGVTRTLTPWSGYSRVAGDSASSASMLRPHQQGFRAEGCTYSDRPPDGRVAIQNSFGLAWKDGFLTPSRDEPRRAVSPESVDEDVARLCEEPLRVALVCLTRSRWSEAKSGLSNPCCRAPNPSGHDLVSLRAARTEDRRLL